MIGNDIVDLSLAIKSSRTIDIRYLNKIFSKAEQEHIYQSARPEETLWLLWSMKESAYKVYVRTHKQPFYAPFKILCELKDDSKGLVNINDQIYHTFSLITKDYVYTIAHSNLPFNIISDCIKIDESTYKAQHSESYANAKKSFSRISGYRSEDMQIVKNSIDVPELYIKKRKSSLTFSITHHGHYCGIAMLDPS